MYTIDFVDDNKIVASGIHLLLSKEAKGFVMGKLSFLATDYLDHLKKKNTTLPHAVIISHKMMGLNGWCLCYILQRDYPQIEKIVISSELDSDWAGRFIITGCKALVSKSNGLEEMLQAIAAVKNGAYYCNNFYSKALVKKMQNQLLQYDFPFNLNANEYFYIYLCQTSLTNAEIARLLNIGDADLHKKQQKLYKKFEVKTHGELVAKAIQLRIIWMFKYKS